MTWPTVGVLVLGTWLTRVAGLLLGEVVGRSQVVRRALELAPLAMIAALIVTGSAAILEVAPTDVAVPPEAVGLAVGLLAFLARAPFLVTFLGVVGATVLGRALL